MIQKADSVESTTTVQSPSSTLGYLALAALFMLIGIMVLAWLGSNRKPPINGKALPLLFLDPLVGDEKTFSTSQLIGSPFLLYLWSPTTETCSEQLARIRECVKDHPDWKLVSIAFPENGALDIEQLRNEVQQRLDEAKLSMPTYVDTKGGPTMELTLLMPFGSFGFPTIFVVDRQGRMCHICEGSNPGSWDQMFEVMRSVK